MTLALFAPPPSHAAAPADIRQCQPDLPCLDDPLHAQQFAQAQKLANEEKNREAEAILVKLTSASRAEIRAEAYFRIGQLREREGDLKGAAVQYRRVLEEQPQAAPVRLQLARILAKLGNEEGALRQLRRASSGGLPPHIARLVDQFQVALRSQKRLGANLEVAVAPNSNINRASDKSQVDIGPFPLALGDDAKAQSGVGASLQAQAYWRPGLTKNTNLLVTVSGSADIYKKARFNDVVGALQVGPELLLGRSRFRVQSLFARRWFGGERYSDTWGGTVNWMQPVDNRTQVQVDLTATRSKYAINPGLDGTFYSGQIRFERALSPTVFARASLRTQRQNAKTPAFSSWTVAGEGLVSAELKHFTLYAQGGYQHIQGDGEFFIPPARRDDDVVELEAGVAIKRLTISGFAPIVRINHTMSSSPVFFYDYRRTRLSAGLTREF